MIKEWKTSPAFKNAPVAKIRKSCWQDAKYLTEANCKSVTYILEQAELNATQTCQEDAHSTPENWDDMFVGSIGVLLCDGSYNRNVTAYFWFRGIAY
tara:strand:- start:70 stop:360 length:291 start_codon:yes stop_codon:yes gene_type:complete